MRTPILLSFLLIICLAAAVSGQKVIATNTPNNPLHVRDLTSKWTPEIEDGRADRQALEVSLVVENKSASAIRVYAVELGGARESDYRGFGLETLQAYELLQPGESRKLDLSKSWYDQKPPLLKVTAQIVNYIYGSARFPAEAPRAKAAFAAGRKAGMAHLQAMVKAQGVDATLEFLETGELPEARKSNQGWGKWELSFQTGVRDVGILFLHANKTGGRTAAEAFLRTPQ